MSDTPFFSIVLCTYNRAALLQGALESLLAIDYPATDFELVLVNNASSDDTAAVAARFAERAPFHVQLVVETRRGLSAARNRGIREARGRYLFFTDDDQLVDARALREHRRVAERFGSRVQQGGIALRFEGERPAWLHGPLAAVLGETRALPEGPQPIDLYGGNMCIARAVFDDFAAFREDLGKGAAGYSEDIELTRRLESGGERLVYAPSALIYHLIAADRASPEFFRKNSWEKGVSDGLLLDPARSVLWLLLGTTLEGARDLVIAASFAPLSQHRSLLAQTRLANRSGRFLAFARKKLGRA